MDHSILQITVQLVIVWEVPVKDAATIVIKTVQQAEILMCGSESVIIWNLVNLTLGHFFFEWGRNCSVFLEKKNPATIVLKQFFQKCSYGVTSGNLEYIGKFYDWFKKDHNFIKNPCVSEGEKTIGTVFQSFTWKVRLLLIFFRCLYTAH